jgi:signal transduction histidine kinase
MALLARARSSSRRTVIYAVAAATVVLLLVAGLAFANSSSVIRVTENAKALHWTNATMGTSALVRAGLVQAVTFAELSEMGVVSSDDASFTLGELDAAADELERLLAMGQGRDSYPPLARYVGAVDGARTDLEAGEIGTAKEQTASDVEETFAELAASLRREQARIMAAQEENSRAGHQLNTWVVFALTLLVPGSAVGVYFVITRRQVRALEERNRLELAAERTISRAKDSFIAGLSHELRTPLTSIYGFAEVLADRQVTGPEATAETAQIIANEASEMTRMVDDLLIASRLESTGVEIEPARTAIQSVLDAAATPFESAGVEIQREATKAVAMVDAPRLRHVLVNLISNAVRHGSPAIGVNVTEGDGVVEIEVWDSGEGVPEDRVDGLFDRFVHDGDAPLLTGSVGLGLAVARRLTGLMGGRLEYQRFGAKTYFVVTVPHGAVTEEEVDEESVADMIRTLSS